MADKTINIDGITVRLFKFSPSAGLPILSRLQNMLGGSVLSMVSAVGKSDAEQAKVMADALDSIVERVAPEKVTKFITDVVCSGFVVVNGVKVGHLDDLAIEDCDPFYLALMITKEQLTYSFGGFLGKFLQKQGS